VPLVLVLLLLLPLLLLALQLLALQLGVRGRRRGRRRRPVRAGGGGARCGGGIENERHGRVGIRTLAVGLLRPKTRPENECGLEYGPARRKVFN
jgi:hypothetical protein